MPVFLENDTHHIVMVISSTNPIGNRGLPRTLGKVESNPLRKTPWEYKGECHFGAGAVDAGDNRVLIVGGYELASLIRSRNGPERCGTTVLLQLRNLASKRNPIYERLFLIWNQ
jgi:hypothetical protein